MLYCVLQGSNICPWLTEKSRKSIKAYLAATHDRNLRTIAQLGNTVVRARCNSGSRLLPVRRGFLAPASACIFDFLRTGHTLVIACWFSSTGFTNAFIALQQWNNPQLTTEQVIMGMMYRGRTPASWLFDMTLDPFTIYVGEPQLTAFFPSNYST